MLLGHPRPNFYAAEGRIDGSDNRPLGEQVLGIDQADRQSKEA